MSRSASSSQNSILGKALQAAQRVLEADTGDLRELAKIAGVDESLLYYRANLTGLDLRGVDIDFLLPLETDFEGAILTDRQRQAFRKEGRKLIRGRVAQKITDFRIEAVTAFIDQYEASGDYLWLSSDDDLGVLSVDLLRNLLLYPLHVNWEVKPDYMTSVIDALSPWASRENYQFYEELFKVLGGIMSAVDSRTENAFFEGYHHKLGRRLGDLIAAFRPTTILDRYWMMTGHDLKRKAPEVLLNARQLGSVRNVDPVAIEDVARTLGWEDTKKLFETVPFDCDNDQAERLALKLVRAEWPDDMTSDMIEAKFPYKVRQAVFRQILGQGRQERVAEIIRWLDQGLGAAGALSLENAFIHIDDFDLAFDLALDLSPRLAQNQREVIKNALLGLARTSEMRARLARHGWR